VRLRHLMGDSVSNFIRPAPKGIPKNAFALGSFVGSMEQNDAAANLIIGKKDQHKRNQGSYKAQETPIADHCALQYDEDNTDSAEGDDIDAKKHHEPRSIEPTSRRAG